MGWWEGTWWNTVVEKSPINATSVSTQLTRQMILQGTLKKQQRKTKPMQPMLRYISLWKCSAETYEWPINATSVHPHNLKQAIWGGMWKTQKERHDICNYCDYKFYLHMSRHRINSWSLKDKQVGYIAQKYTLDKYTLEKYSLEKYT